MTNYQYKMNEQALYQRMIDAQYEYMKFIRVAWSEKFSQETKDYVWDSGHWAYKYFRTDVTPQESSMPDPELKILYRKLSLYVHPDKCTEPWANEIFIKINRAYKKGNLEKLQKLNDHWELHETFKNYTIKEKSKEKMIKRWSSELWFQWFSPGTLLKDCFISPDEYKRRLEEREETLITLTKENEHLKSKIEQLSKGKSE